MTPACLLYRALVEPAVLNQYRATDWNALIRIARAERLLGSVAACIDEAGLADSLTKGVQSALADEKAIIAFDHLRAGWEIDRARHALQGLGAPVLLLKGSAYLHAGLPPARGRRIGDLDILVPRAALGDAEAMLKAHGWEAVKDDPYDEHYYRAWMHELPPMVHRERGGVIDVHHTILPLTARITPDAGALVASAVPAGGGLSVLGPAEMLLHAAAHLAYDGAFDGGARNLWDIHQLAGFFGARPGFWDDLRAAARRHTLVVPLMRSLRLARMLYGTASPVDMQGSADVVDRLAARKLHGRDAFGIQSARLGDQLLYMRGHWLRMPPLMLARHLIRKYRVRHGQARG